MSKEVKERVRKMFTECLPRRIYKTRDCVYWEKSIGYIVKGIYYDLEFEVEIVDYMHPNLYIKYLTKPIFRINIRSFSNCCLGNLLGENTSEFKIDIGTAFKDNKRDLTITDREIRVRYKKDKTKCNDKWYKYTCNKCGWTEGWILESELKRGNGCSCCYGRTAVLGINTIWDTDRWMCDLGMLEEDAKIHTCGSDKRVNVICPDCGRVKDISIGGMCRDKTIHCICVDGKSYPEKFLFNLLEQLHVEFICEYSPKWIKPRRYDFFIPSFNLIIETDGGLGHGGKIRDRNKMTKEESLEIDKYKDKIANEHGIEVIRIDCRKSEYKYIRNNILMSKLNNLFSLSNINWNNCEKFALSNRIKEACDLWNSNEYTTTELSKYMKLSYSSIINYLIKGGQIKWCNYKKTKINNIEIFKGDISLGIFESVRILEEKSENIFGVKLYSSGIANVANGRFKQYKGYTFQYIVPTDIIV